MNRGRRGRIALAGLLAAALLMAGAAPHRGRGDGKKEDFVIRASGTAYAPKSVGDPVQAQLMARRGSEVVALRNLAALVSGAEVAGDPRDSRSWVRAFIKGYRVVETKAGPDGSFTTVVELPLENVGGNFQGAVTKADLLEARVRQLENETAAYRKVLDETVAELAMAQVSLDAKNRENHHLRAEIRRLQDELAGLKSGRARPAVPQE